MSDTVIMMAHSFSGLDQGFFRGGIQPVTVVAVDLDIDSDNNDGFDPPARSIDEDNMEDDATKPGRILLVNSNDDDADGIPDLADGFDYDGNPSNADNHTSNEVFVPLILELSGAINLSQAVLNFTYSASDPAEVLAVVQEAEIVYQPAPGNLRLWRKPGNQPRNKMSVEVGGDYIPAGMVSASNLPFEGSVGTLYVEAIAVSPSVGHPRILVEVDPDGDGPVGFVSDAVRVGALELKLMQGDVDLATGRGKLGAASEVLHATPSGLNNISDPAPLVTITTFEVGNVARSSQDKLVCDVSVSGTVTFALADIVPDGKGDPTQAMVRFNGKEVTTLALQKVAEPTSFLRPYAARFEFTAVLSAIHSLAFENNFEIVVEDPLLKNLGRDFISFMIQAEGAAEAEAAPTPEVSQFQDQLTNNLFQYRLDLTGGGSLSDIAALGPNAVAVGIRVPERYAPYDVTYGTLTFDGPNDAPQVASGNELAIVMNNTESLGLDAATEGTIVATVKWTGPAAPQTYVFRETSASSSVYETTAILATLELPQTLDPSLQDDVKLVIVETLNAVAVGTDTITLSETSSESMTFAGGGFTLTLPAPFALSPAQKDVFVAMADLAARGKHLFQFTETGLDTKVFTSQRSAMPSIVVGDLDHVSRWAGGPWVVSDLQPGQSESPGSYRPFTTRIEGPVDISMSLLNAAEVRTFGIDHGLIVHEGALYSSGQEGIQGLFVVAPVDESIPDEDVIGAGHVSKTDGFVFGSLKGTFLGTAEVETKKTYVSGGVKLFTKLLALSDQLRDDRFSGDAQKIRDSYYDPKWGDVEGEEPYAQFADKLFTEYFQKAKDDLGKAEFDKEVMDEAIRLLNRTDNELAPAHFRGAGIDLYRKVREELAASLPTTPVIGSHFLIGHWDPAPEGLGHLKDMEAQTQTVTSILHFNTGLSYKAEENRLKLATGLFLLPEGTEEQKRDKHAMIMVALEKEGLLAWMTTKLDGTDAISSADMAAARSFATAVLATFENGLPTDATTEVFDRVKAKLDERFAMISKSDKYIEIAHIYLTSQMWSGGGNINTLALYTVYDAVSREGFGHFGIDSFNDIICSEAGARLAQDLHDGYLIKSADALRQKLEVIIKNARKDFLLQEVLISRKRALSAFLSVQYYYEAPFFVLPSTGQPYNVWIWKRTIGTILQKNEAHLQNAEKATAFVNAVEAHLKTGQIEAMDATAEGYAVDTDDTRALHQMVEVLSLIGTPR